MRRLYSALWLLCLLGATTVGLAQSLDISGKVVIQGTEDPLPGVTIIVKGTTINTVTNGDGGFSLGLKGMSEATLQFSFVGFKTVTEQVSASNANLNVAMEAAPLEVSEEVVVTGFATSVKRKNLANSVATVSAAEISRIPTQTLDGALSAKFTGVTVSQNTGAPGGGISVNLRGTSTINGATQPLYVVDGVLVSNMEIQSGVNAVTSAAGAGSRTPQDQPSNRIADLIPSDIASIEVLKGPSAAAIYGSKASNGVVIITTKRGSSGETQYDFSQGFGFREIVKKLGFRTFTAETAFASFGQTGLDLFNQAAGRVIDYEAELYGETGAIFQTNFSARGGNEKTSFFVSGSSLNDDGIIDGTGYDKYGIRVNVDHNVNHKLSIGVRTNIIRSVSNRGLTGNDNTGATFGVALTATPSFLDLRPTDGVYPQNPFASNFLQTRDLMRNEETVNRTIASVTVDYNIFQNAKQSLDFNLAGGVDYFSMENDARFPRELEFEADSTQPGTSILGETESIFNNLYLNLTHTFISGSGHTFRTTGGVQFEEQDVDNVLITANNLIEGQFNVDQGVAPNVTQTRTIQRDRGFFVQEEINLGEAVFLSLGIRGDSSSAIGDEDKFYSYPKASVSVRLSEYDFWEPLESFLSEFKVRSAYGETGNLPPAFAKFSSFTSLTIDNSNGLVPGTLRGNPNIEPETSAELEFGFDATILGGIATAEFSYFKQEISDLILFRDLEPSSGFTQEVLNAGEMEIDGIEFGLNINPIKTSRFNWTVGLNYYAYDSEITRLDIPEFTKGGFATSLGTYLISEGFSPTTIVGNETDANGNFIPLGDQAPDFQLGWNNEMRYGNWNLSWLLDWKEGSEVVNLTKLLSDLNGTTLDLDTPEGAARAGNAFATTQQLIEDSGYVKLREIKLEYQLNRGMLNRIVYGKLSSLRFSLSGRNLKTWTDYTSYDPEVSNFGNLAIGGSIEVAPFPTSKSYYFNIAAGL